MSLSRARLNRAAIITAAAVLSAIAIAGCALQVPLPMLSGTTSPAAGPSPSTTSTPIVGLNCGVVCARVVVDSFGCAGGSDCGLRFFRDCVCLREIADYRIIVRGPDGSEAMTGRLLFPAGETTTTLRLQTSGPATSIDVELSVNGSVVKRQNVIVTG